MNPESNQRARGPSLDSVAELPVYNFKLNKAENQPFIGNTKSSLIFRFESHTANFLNYLSPRLTNLRLGATVLALISAGFQLRSVVDLESDSAKYAPYFLFSSLICLAGANALHKDLLVRVGSHAAGLLFTIAVLDYHLTKDKISAHSLTAVQAVAILSFVFMAFNAINHQTETFKERLKTFFTHPHNKFRNMLIGLTAIINIVALGFSIEGWARNKPMDALTSRLSNDLTPVSFIPVVFTIMTMIWSNVRTPGHTRSHVAGLIASQFALAGIITTAVLTMIEDFGVFNERAAKTLPALVGIVTALMGVAEYFGLSPLKPNDATQPILDRPTLGGRILNNGADGDLELTPSINHRSTAPNLNGYGSINSAPNTEYTSANGTSNVASSGLNNSIVGGYIGRDERAPSEESERSLV